MRVMITKTEFDTLHTMLTSAAHAQSRARTMDGNPAWNQAERDVLFDEVIDIAYSLKFGTEF